MKLKGNDRLAIFGLAFAVALILLGRSYRSDEATMAGLFLLTYSVIDLIGVAWRYLTRRGSD